MRAAVLWWSLCTTAAAAASATGPAVYRCGNSYSQTPCPDARTIDAADPRSPAQRAAASSLATDDRRRLGALEAERRKQERASRPAVASGFDSRSAPASTAGSAAARSTAGKSPKHAVAASAAKDFSAVAPTEKKPKKPPTGVAPGADVR